MCCVTHMASNDNQVQSQTDMNMKTTRAESCVLLLLLSLLLLLLLVTVAWCRDQGQGAVAQITFSFVVFEKCGDESGHRSMKKSSRLLEPHSFGGFSVLQKYSMSCSSRLAGASLCRCPLRSIRSTLNACRVLLTGPGDEDAEARTHAPSNHDLRTDGNQAETCRTTAWHSSGPS